jgi:hypothetical protein
MHQHLLLRLLPPHVWLLLLLAVVLPLAAMLLLQTSAACLVLLQAGECSRKQYSSVQCSTLHSRQLQKQDNSVQCTAFIKQQSIGTYRRQQHRHTGRGMAVPCTADSDMQMHLLIRHGHTVPSTASREMQTACSHTI